jgi:hypothetical protein
MDPSVSRRQRFAVSWASSTGSSASRTSAIRWLVVRAHSGSAMLTALRIGRRPPAHPTSYSAHSDGPSDNSTSTPGRPARNRSHLTSPVRRRRAPRTSPLRRVCRDSKVRSSWPRLAILPLDPALAASPPAGYILILHESAARCVRHSGGAEACRVPRSPGVLSTAAMSSGRTS